MASETAARSPGTGSAICGGACPVAIQNGERRQEQGRRSPNSLLNDRTVSPPAVRLVAAASWRLKEKPSWMIWA